MKKLLAVFVTLVVLPMYCNRVSAQAGWIEYRKAQDYLNKKDTANAIKYYQEAINQGFVIAEDLLANLYDRQKNYTKAYPLWLSLANRGVREVGANNQTLLFWGRFHVAQYKESGKGTIKDLPGAVTWYRKAIQIDTPANGWAYLCLGYCYLDGRGVVQNGDMAFMNFKKAEGRADTESAIVTKVALAGCYLEGAGCQQSFSEVYRLLDSVKNGDNSMVQLLLGIAYYKDDTVADHYKQAVHWLTLAANNNNDKDKAAAMYWLAKCYRFGRGVAQDIGKAEELTQAASAYGDENALSVLKLIGGSR